MVVDFENFDIEQFRLFHTFLKNDVYLYGVMAVMVIRDEEGEVTGMERIHPSSVARDPLTGKWAEVSNGEIVGYFDSEDFVVVKPINDIDQPSKE